MRLALQYPHSQIGPKCAVTDTDRQVESESDIPTVAIDARYAYFITSSAAALPTYPLQLELTSPLKVARWRPLVQWILVVPHVSVLYGLLIAQFAVGLMSWFAILFTGKMPDGLFGFTVMVMRYQWRVTTYILFMRENYPPFDLNRVGEDPGGDPAVLSAQTTSRLSRGLIFVKLLLVIPHLFVLLFLGIAVSIAIFIGFFAVLVTGSWPEGMRRFVVGAMRWSHRVSAYSCLLTDQYPPFSLS